MTWQTQTNINSGGNGPVEFRLEILGFDYSFCTSILMANNNTTVKRIPGLLREGLTMNQEIIFPDMTYKLNSNNFTIVDYQQQAIQAFFRKPTVNAQLLESVFTYSSTFIVSNITNIVAGQYLWIGQECVRVLGTVSGETKYITVERAQLGTTALKHSVTTDLGIPVKPTIKNIPNGLEKRKCILYAYGEGDDLQGTGTAIWRGLISTDIKTTDGVTFSIEAQPITELLNTSCGIDGAEIKLRGINFGPWRWWIRISLLDSNNLKTGNPQSKGNPYTFFIYAEGFYETVYDLVNNLNSQIQTAMFTGVASTGTNWSGISIGCGFDGNELYFWQLQAGTTYVVQFTTAFAPLNADATFGSKQTKNIMDCFNVDDQNLYFYQNGLINTVAKWQKYDIANSIAVQRMKDPAFPQTFSIYSKYDFSTLNPIAASTSTQKYGLKLYLDTKMFLSTINDILIVNSDEEEVIRTYPWQLNNIVLDTTNRAITLSLQYDTIVSGIKKNIGNYVVFLTNNDFKIYVGTSFGMSSQNIKTGNIIDFIAYLCDHSAENLYNAAMPLITRDDFDIDDMKSVLATLPAQPFVNNRNYTFYKKIDNLQKYILEEYKLLGIIPALTPTGKMTVRQLRNVNSYETPDYTLDMTNTLTDQNFFTMEMNKFGITNVVEMKYNYEPIKDKYKTNLTFNNIDSVGTFGKGKTFTIAPQSKYVAAQNVDQLSNEETQNIIARSLSVLAYPYQVITLDVPLKYFYAPLGATARVISKNIPNFAPQATYTDNRRGVNRMLGTIIGKNFDLGKGYGRISLLVSDQEFVYNDIGQKFILAPDGYCDSVATAGGNIFTFNALNSKPWIPVGKHSDYWSVGQTMKFEGVNSQTQNVGYGKILEMVDNGTYTTFTVNCNSPYATPTNFTTGNFIFKVPEYNYSYIAAAQRTYGFIDSGTTDPDGTNRCNGTLSRLLSP